MAQYTVVVPVNGTEKTTNHKGELIGIPFLGESRRYIMNEDEIQSWFEMWKADKSMPNTFYIERHPR